MDHYRFDAMTRSVGTTVSRRGFGQIASAAGFAAAFGSLTLVDANARKHRTKKRRKPVKEVTAGDAVCTPNCSDRTCGNDGCGGSCGACDAGQVCTGGLCCVPESRSATCGGRCGTWSNNCGQPIECSRCAAGRVCLSNGSCAIACTDNNDCDGGGACTDRPNVEGERHCTGGLVRPIVTCTSTADCPPRSICREEGIDGVVCIELSV